METYKWHKKLIVEILTKPVKVLATAFPFSSVLLNGKYDFFLGYNFTILKELKEIADIKKKAEINSGYYTIDGVKDINAKEIPSISLHTALF